jgi:hypothetical protein
MSTPSRVPTDSGVPSIQFAAGDLSGSVRAFEKDEDATSSGLHPHQPRLPGRHPVRPETGNPATTIAGPAGWSVRRTSTQRSPCG